MTRPRGAVGKDRTVSARRLRGPLKRVFAILKKAGVPVGAMPSNDHVAGLLVRWIDWDAVKAWADGIAAAHQPVVTVRIRKRAKKP